MVPDSEPGNEDTGDEVPQIKIPIVKSYACNIPPLSFITCFVTVIVPDPVGGVGGQNGGTCPCF